MFIFTLVDTPLHHQVHCISEEYIWFKVNLYGLVTFHIQVKLTIVNCRTF